MRGASENRQGRPSYLTEPSNETNYEEREYYTPYVVCYQSFCHSCGPGKKTEKKKLFAHGAIDHTEEPKSQRKTNRLIFKQRCALIGFAREKP